MSQKELRDFEGTDSIDYTDPETLRRLYHGEGMSTVEIAKRTDVTDGTIGYWMDKHGIEKRTRSEAQRVERALYTHANGKYPIWVCNWKDTRDTVLVHRLLAVSEYGFGSLDGKVVHHKNGVPWDNRIENLEIMGVKEHHSHHSEGETHPSAKLSREDVSEIVARLDDDVSMKEMANEYGVSPATIRLIDEGETWAHVTNKGKS